MYQLGNVKFAYVWVMRKRERGVGGKEGGEAKDDNVTGTCMHMLLSFPPKGMYAHDFILLSLPTCVVIGINALSPTFQI